MEGVLQNYTNILIIPGMDPEVDAWATMGSPYPMLSIVVSYLFFTYHFGPKMMANRKPLDIKQYIIVYNAIQVLWATYVFLLPLQYPNLFTAFASMKSSHENRSQPWWKSVIYLSWCIYISKIIDLTDTVFFVLRKKQSQISFLHVWHHSLMVPSAWFFLKYIQEPQFLPMALLNTFVHMVMYTYYMIAAMGPQYAKYIWWKKYMTRIQLGQFGIVIVYMGTLWTMSVPISKFLLTYVVVNMFILIGLFGNFYIKAYHNHSKLKNN